MVIDLCHFVFYPDFNIKSQRNLFSWSLRTCGKSMKKKKKKHFPQHIVYHIVQLRSVWYTSRRSISRYLSNKLKHLVDRFSHQAEDNKNYYFFLVELYLGCVWDLKKKVNLFYFLAYFCFSHCTVKWVLFFQKLIFNFFSTYFHKKISVSIKLTIFKWTLDIAHIYDALQITAVVYPFKFLHIV